MEKVNSKEDNFENKAGRKIRLDRLVTPDFVGIVLRVTRSKTSRQYSRIAQFW